MKRLKITLTAFLLLSAVLTGCTAEKNYVTDEIIRENASFYRGKTVRFLNENRVSGGVDTITNAEGQFLYHDAFGWYGDLPIVDAVSFRGIPYEYVHFPLPFHLNSLRHKNGNRFYPCAASATSMAIACVCD